ncbi:hypothetical protein ACFOJ6_15230 [Gordonia humi]
MVWKVNTLGEEDFLRTLTDIVEPMAKAAPDDDVPAP